MHDRPETILRVKRKLNENQITTFLVATSSQNSKKPKVEQARVFTLLQSAVPANALGLSEESRKLKMWHDKHKTLLKAHRLTPSLDEKRELLSARKLARDARFKVANEKRKIAMHDDVSFTVVELERDEHHHSDDGGMQAVLDAMVDTYIDDNKIEPSTTADADQEYVYDFYVYNETVPVSQALQQGMVATLEMEEDVVYLNDEPTESDIGSDEDSNAEDYYQNDYPEEDSDRDAGLDPDFSDTTSSHPDFDSDY
ncbi:hypothetical protein HDV03_002747 [Kappamyces sp. JEL0829]|nr:hypothetical protein HDV03_002747 [Kappamyces sp. JEL0829]